MSRAGRAAKPVVRGRVFPLAVYADRRRRLMAAIGQRYQPMPLLLLGANAADRETGSAPIPSQARQDAWFDWASGCHEPGAALLIAADGRASLFLPPSDERRTLWEGPALAPGAEAARAFALADCHPIGELRQRCREAAQAHAGHLAVLAAAGGFQASAARRWRTRLRDLRVIDASPAAIPLRMIKGPEEIAAHRQAVRRSARALGAVMARIPALPSEAAVAGALVEGYIATDAAPLAFTPIVAGGANAAVLHYPHNDRPLPRRGPVLIDSGATWGGYCADITRTLPRHGRFSDPRLRELYALVLRSQQRATRHARPGITLRELDDIAWQPIIAAGFAKRHGISHHIGLEVHDCCDRSLPLAPGMIISNEPGIYLPEEQLGIRIEDDLLITATGCEVTTRAIPKSISAIEKRMRE